MITWMQKHKKYLVITIWISTIAFVGAGFVGWGAYKFGTAADAIATVGETKVTYEEYNRRYTRLYEYYNRMLGGTLDQEKAKQMQLDKAALDQLIQEALLLSYAKELGLQVSDEEVANHIAGMKVFWNKGKFDQELYKKILAQNRMRPKAFEESIRKELLLQKLARAFAPVLYDVEFDTIAAALYMGDKIEYKALSTQDINVTVTEEEIANYYQAHKNDYKSPKKFKLSYITITPKDANFTQAELQEYYKKHRLAYAGDDGKIMPFAKVKERVAKDLALKRSKKEALKAYIAFKKGKRKPEGSITVTQNNALPPKVAQKLAKASKGTTFKPAIQEGKYYIYRLEEVILPKPMALAKVHEKVKNDLEASKKRKALMELAKKRLATFQGIITPDFVTREDIDKIALPPAQAELFLRQLFLKTEPKGIIAVDQNKVVLYKILDQKLAMQRKIDKNRAFITDNGLKLKQMIIDTNTLKKLQKRYTITIYKKGQ